MTNEERAIIYREILRSQRDIKERLNLLICATPTGEERDKITEANIHYLYYADALVAAEKIFLHSTQGPD